MNYKGINDYELIYRIRENNDEEAINDLIYKYEPLIAKLARKYYEGGCQGVDINDFMQEGRIAVVKALKMFDFNSSSLFYTYVSVCINRHFITYCRGLVASKHNALNYSISEDVFACLSDYSYEPFTCLDNKSYDLELMKNIYSMKLIDGSILELRYNGFSYKEISELLDISISSVSRHLCKIKKSLQVIKDKF